MSLVYLAILKEAERRERLRAEAHRRKNASKKAETVHEKPYKPSLKDIIRDDSKLVSCMFSFLEENPDTLAVFEKLIENSDSLYKADLAKTDDELISMIPQSEQIAREYDEAYKNMSGTGLDVYFESDDLFWYIKHPKFPDSAKYDYYTTPMPMSINGIALTTEMVQSDMNPYLERLKAFYEQNPNCEEEFTKIKQETDKLKSHKLRLKLSKSEQQHLRELEVKLADLAPLVEQKHEYERHAEIYASLSEDQKGALIDYIEKQQAMRELSEKVTTLRSKHLFQLGYNSGYAHEENYKNYTDGFVSTAMEGLSSEETQKIDKLFDDVIVFLLSATPDELIKRTNFSKRVILDDNMMKKTALSGLSDYIAQQISETLSQAEAEALKSKQY